MRLTRWKRKRGMAMETQERNNYPFKSQWDFYALCVKVGVPLVLGIALYVMARKGDVTAIVILVTIGVVLLIGLGVLVTIAIMNQMGKAEERRFVGNLKENMLYLGQIQNIQNRQLAAATRTNNTLITANQKLLAGALSPDNMDVDALGWEVEEDTLS
jgi:hypothetical protein